MPEDAGILDLDALLPKDLVIKYQGEEWRIAGDLSVERSLRLMKALDELLAEQKDKTLLETGPALKQCQALILDALKERHPDLEECPFGINSMAMVFHQILLKLGIITSPPPAADGEGDPTSPAKQPASTPKKMAVPKGKVRGSSTRSRSS
jgi:hypothetical protein